MPTVSIVIPAYNPGFYLELAILSVVAQTLTDWELIIVDDGSPQDISPVTALHPAIRILRQNNKGQSVARNVGILNAAGEYIAFLDQDDLWKPTKLAKQVAVMQEHSEAALCHTQFDLVDQNGAYQGAGFGRQQTYLEMLEGSGICGSSSVMLRRESLLACGLFDRFSQPAEDYDLWLRISSSYETVFIPDCEVSYRQHSQNQSLNYRNTYLCIRQIMHKHIRFAQAREDQTAVQAGRRGLQRIRGTFGAQAFDHCRQSVRRRTCKPFLSHFGFALYHAPSYVSRSLLSHIMRRRLIAREKVSGS